MTFRKPGSYKIKQKYSDRSHVINGNYSNTSKLTRILLAILFLSIFFPPARSQEYRILIHPAGGEGPRGFPPDPQALADSMQVYRVIKDLLVELRGEGYLAASLDSLEYDSLEVQAWIYAGPRFEWGSLFMDSIERNIVRRAGLRSSAFSGRPVRSARLAAAQERLLAWYEDNGYPFAGIYLEDIQIRGKEISARMKVEAGDLFRIDTLHVRGDVRIDQRYIERLCGLQSNDIYRENRIRQIGDRILECDFLEEIKPAEMEFFRGAVDVYTYLQKSRANQFNGIIGVFPNHEQTGRLFVTGDLHLYLINSFGMGESFRFAWKALQPLSQELDVSVDWPYVFSSMVGVGVDFSLLKQDTSWLSVNPVLDLRFFLGGASYFNVFYDYFNSSLISTWGMENLTRLPAHADVSSSMYGLGMQYRNLDYLFNPRRGWNLQARMGIGSRKIRKNPALPDEAYESIDLIANKLRAVAEVGYFQPLGGRFCLHLENRSGYLRSKNLFENELFRLGGIHTLRGVDENSVYASLYSLLTVEARFLFERNSNFFLFFDGGYYEKETGNEFLSDFPIGFGAGVNLSTRAGIFSLVYALGKQFENPLNIGNAKIHLGYLNRF